MCRGGREGGREGGRYRCLGRVFADGLGLQHPVGEQEMVRRSGQAVVGGQGGEGGREGGGHEDAADVDVDVDGGEAGRTGLEGLDGFPDVGTQHVIGRDESTGAARVCVCGCGCVGVGVCVCVCVCVVCVWVC